jgi:GTP-binding protein LepA
MDHNHHISTERVRNFVIIAHIDHGKSTLADRMLEVTGTVEARRMKPQYLDQMDLERERGITIKLAPVRMEYQHKGETYELNLIDTPGHSDFGYEVSRALEAVEGAVLLVDVTKGIQAQTLSNFRIARKAGLKIVGAVNKVDLRPESADHVAVELARLLDCEPSEILRISGKSGQGVADVLDRVIAEVPAPVSHKEDKPLRALIFDSVYDDHKGILAYVRVMEGELKAGREVHLLSTGATARTKEIGIFAPELRAIDTLRAGHIGYIATGLKEPAMIKIGDTVGDDASQEPLPGYREASPVVFISFYPDGDTKFEDIKKAFERLHLNDPAISFEQDANEALGRGIKAGFLGQLHFEIASTRLSREFNLEFLTSFPSIAHRVRSRGKDIIIKNSEDWPTHVDEAYQPMIKLEILTPASYMDKVLALAQVFDIRIETMETLGDNLVIESHMPLSELIRDFDDQIKSASAGYASFSYELDGEEKADVAKMEILIAGEAQPALTRIVNRKDAEREGRSTVERLKDLLPKQQFVQAIQAAMDGKIIARETIGAIKKNLGDFGKNGGDITRKMKLWRKQDRGKKRLQAGARVNVPIEVFREILKK